MHDSLRVIVISLIASSFSPMHAEGARIVAVDRGDRIYSVSFPDRVVPTINLPTVIAPRVANGAVDGCSIDAALPQGLSINKACVVTGTAVNPYDAGRTFVYRVFARNRSTNKWVETQLALEFKPIPARAQRPSKRGSFSIPF